MKMLIIKFVTVIQIIFVSNSLPQIIWPNKRNKSTTTPKPNTKSAADILYEKCFEYSKIRFENLTMHYWNCERPKPLIKGGVPALPKEFPHMALLGFPNSFTDWQSHTNIQWSCGGSLISDRYVLTAAHCRYRGGNVEAKWVRLGELVLNTKIDDAKPKDFDIIEFIPYPQYNSARVYHDIMLLKLNETVEFNQFIRPICLYNRAKLPQIFENNSIITGWGLLGTGEMESDELGKAAVNLVKDKECSKFYPPDQGKLPAGLKSIFMICAGNQGNDTCEAYFDFLLNVLYNNDILIQQGDSGGPLQALIPGMECMYYQLGITSYGNSFCGRKGIPTIYTRIAPYIPWIQSIVWPR